MRIIRTILLVLLLIVVILVAVGALIFNNWTRGPLPQHSGEITVEGLKDTVTIRRDEWGVAHLYASSSYDLFFAQGYTQAQDRWWQMEFSRHIGQGAIQELTGQSDAVMGTDLFARKIGWYRAAEKIAAAMPEDIVTQLQAFADGVNAYITNRPAGSLAFEYNLLGVTGVNIPIEEWTIVDTIVWSRVMAWNLSGNGSSELFRSDLLEAMDASQMIGIVPEFPFDEKPTILFEEDLPLSDESLTSAQFNTPDRGIAGLSPQQDDLLAILQPQEGIGSNNWVVSGAKSASGSPLLANDPHLGIGMPSIWYEIGLHCRPVSDECPYDVVGFALVPSPAVIIGHNARIAWGVTNVGWDTQDYYLIEVNPDNPLQYRWDGEWRDMTVHEETIHFGDGGDPVTIQVRETHFGPIMNDNFVNDDGTLSGFNNENPRAMRWTALESGTLIEAIFRLNTAQNWEEFRAAASLWDSPSQNMVYADVDGNIGYQTPGLIPIRANGHTGQAPIDGTSSEFEWKGFVPFDNLPRIFNPDRGYIATANQALVPLEYYDQLAEQLGEEFGADSHYIFGYDWDYGYRGQRIVEMLEAEEKHNFESFQAIHGDNKIIIAEELASYLKDLDMGSDPLNDARDWMLDWDYQMHMDSPQAALFGSFWGRLMVNLFNDQLDGDTVSGGSQSMFATSLLADDPENIWWDDAATTDAVETRDDILQRAFTEAHAEVTDRLGSDRSKWSWGSLHTATFVSNPLGLSGIDLVEGMVNRGPFPASGGTSIVNATGWSDISSGDFTLSSLPSMRMIVDLSDLSKSLTIHTTGQSGHPFSDHYADMVDPWRKIEYKPMLWTDEQVEAGAKDTLTLKPGQ